MLIDQTDQFALHLADQDHPHDIHGFGRRHPESALELRLDPEPIKHLGNLRSAAVHYDRAEASHPQEDDVFSKLLL
jgi:hypothetical protein